MYRVKNRNLNREGLALKWRSAVWVLLLSLACGLFGCNEQDPRQILSNDRQAPGTVTDVHVKNLNGAAEISYKIPEDLDLLYVEADYELRPGYPLEVQASYYNDRLLVNGFGDTNPHTVMLTSVDRSGNRSSPIEVTVNPLISPVQQAYKSLSYREDFGGVNVTFSNETESDLVVTVLVKDSTGDWVDYDKDYTSLADGNFSVRGLPAIPTTFGVFVQDRWDNFSDTMVQKLIPFFEMELDKSKFSPVEGLPNDADNSWDTNKVWDDDPNRVGGSNGFSSKNSGLPASFTIDLGVPSQISRFRIWQVHDGREYSSGNIQLFQLWGTNDLNPDGSWDNWILLKDAEVVKPSGLPAGELSNEDKETAAAGDEFTLPVNTPAVRYVRFKVLSTFASPPGSVTATFWMLEATFWGRTE